MKKTAALFLCLALIFSSCAVIAGANDEKYSDYPVILVPGYSSSYFYDGDTGEHIWGIDTDNILDMVLSNIAQVGESLGALTVGNTQKIADLVGNGMVELVGKMACNPDGTSKYNIMQYYQSAEDSRYSTLLEKYPDQAMYTETEICAEIASYITYDNLFQFTCDFRMSQEKCATQLDIFIEDVCRLTGKDKVNIFAVSHGGQTTSTYLTLFGWKNRVNNAVLTIPAIGGAGLAYDVLTEDVHLDEECLLRFIEYGTGIEEDYNWLVKANELGFLDDIIKNLMPYLMQVLNYWESMWDFVPVDKYEQVKEYSLDATESAGLIKTSDRYHYEIQPLVGEKMRECRENGANISIIAGYNTPIVSGLRENSDGIITTVCSSGATCAPFGKQFPAGYTQINPCDGQYMIDPSMTLDASTAYLPDSTWFVNGLFHGMTYRDLYTRDLMMTLLLTDKLKDVNSDPDYPRFRDNSCSAMGVYAEFNNGTPGYLDSKADKLIIRNCCNESWVKINSVTVRGADFRIRLPLMTVLQPGESLDAEIKGNIPEVGRQTVDVTICFDISTITPKEYRTQTFTLMNGKDAENNGEFGDVGVTVFGDLIGEKASSFLKTLGLYEFISMIYNDIVYWFKLAF